VVNLPERGIEETPDFGTALGAPNILGMAKTNGKVVSLLDIDRVAGSDAGQVLSQVSTGKESAKAGV
jgi:chemotaxis signal transduction protein